MEKLMDRKLRVSDLGFLDNPFETLNYRPSVLESISAARKEMLESGFLFHIASHLDDTYPTNALTQTFLAGGAFVSWLNGDEVNDYDIFVANNECLKEYSEVPTIISGAYVNSLGPYSRKTYQLIPEGSLKRDIFSRHPTLDPVYNFDFIHNMMYVSIDDLLSDQKFEEFLEGFETKFETPIQFALDKKLKFNRRRLEKTVYFDTDDQNRQFNSLVRRVIKFLSRGWSISHEEIIILIGTLATRQFISEYDQFYIPNDGYIKFNSVGNSAIENYSKVFGNLGEKDDY